MAHIFGIHYLRDGQCIHQGCTATVCKAGKYFEVADSNGKLMPHPNTHHGHIHFRVPCANGHPNDLLYPEDVELRPLSKRLTPQVPPAVFVREF